LRGGSVAGVGTHSLESIASNLRGARGGAESKTVGAASIRGGVCSFLCSKERRSESGCRE
jgi:hypothetical protein